MAKPIEEVTLESYEKILIKANLEESKNHAGTYTNLRKCFRVEKHNHNLFLETNSPQPSSKTRRGYVLLKKKILSGSTKFSF